MKRTDLSVAPKSSGTLLILLSAVGVLLAMCCIATSGAAFVYYTYFGDPERVIIGRWTSDNNLPMLLHRTVTYEFNEDRTFAFTDSFLGVRKTGTWRTVSKEGRTISIEFTSSMTLRGHPVGVENVETEHFEVRSRNEVFQTKFKGFPLGDLLKRA